MRYHLFADAFAALIRCDEQAVDMMLAHAHEADRLASVFNKPDFDVRQILLGHQLFDFQKIIAAQEVMRSENAGAPDFSQRGRIGPVRFSNMDHVRSLCDKHESGSLI